MTEPTLWALKAPDGKLDVTMVGLSIDLIMSKASFVYLRRWDALERMGYSIVRVEVKEMKPVVQKPVKGEKKKPSSKKITPNPECGFGVLTDFYARK